MCIRDREYIICLHHGQSKMNRLYLSMYVAENSDRMVVRHMSKIGFLKTEKATTTKTHDKKLTRE